MWTQLGSWKCIVRARQYHWPTGRWGCWGRTCIEIKTLSRMTIEWWPCPISMSWSECWYPTLHCRSSWGTWIFWSWVKNPFWPGWLSTGRSSSIIVAWCLGWSHRGVPLRPALSTSPSGTALSLHSTHSLSHWTHSFINSNQLSQQQPGMAALTQSYSSPNYAAYKQCE